jgi:hypothetical protein
MSERIGKILGDASEHTAFILEEGGGRNVFEFKPREVNGISDQKDRNYPTRLAGRIVKFALTENNKVISISPLVFRRSTCALCEGRAITLAAKYCTCGNITNSAYKHCEVCAVRNGECARCGNQTT